MNKHISMAILVIFATASLSACGVRGKLSPPPGEKAVKTDGVPDTNPKHRPFILDKLVK